MITTESSLSISVLATIHQVYKFLPKQDKHSDWMTFCVLSVVTIFLGSFSPGLVKILVQPSMQVVVVIIVSVVRHVMYGI